VDPTCKETVVSQLSRNNIFSYKSLMIVQISNKHA
jgi:hypothetical protein